MYAAVENNSGNVPAFLVKLWTLVEDPSTDELIHWDASGTSFHVYDQQRFSREILPLYFKHNNIASFIRQLNMYGFRKVTHIDQGGLKIEKDDLQFQHQYFQRGERDMLQFIKRKVSAQAVRTTDHLVAAKTDEVSRVLSDMKQVKSKQESMDENLEYIRRENKLLWREVALLRQKHHNQQELVNKLIKFLVSIVNSSRTGLSIPAVRRVPLAINDVSQLAPATTVSGQATLGIQGGSTLSDSLPFIVLAPSPGGVKEGQTDDVAYKVESPKVSDFLLSPSPSINGPIIHELTESPQTILVPVTSIGLVNQMSTVTQQNVIHPGINSNQSPSASTTKAASVVLKPSVQSHPATAATIAVGSPGDPVSFLMSPKIEAAPSLEDALRFGLNVPSSSNITSPTTSFLQTGQHQKRKRKTPSVTTGSVAEPSVTPAKRSTPSPQMTASQRQPMSDPQVASLNNIMMTNSDLNLVADGEGNQDASLAVAFSKDNDEFTISSDQLDLLSSDLDGLKGILQDHYKVDPSFLMELFDSSNPWPVIPEKDLSGIKAEQVKDEPSLSEIDSGTITGTELVEYNPKDELFPELMDDNIIGDIDDID